MSEAPRDALLDDLNLTHAFLNGLVSAYQGLYVFEKASFQLTRSAQNEQNLTRIAGVLDTVNAWWGAFERKEPLMRHRFREESLPEDPARAWRLLETAQGRLDGLAEVLLGSTSAEALLQDADLRAIRVAAFCESAYARHHFVQGLVRYGEVMGCEEVADRWRQHLLHTQAQIGRAGRLLQQVLKHGAGEGFNTAEAEALLDATLTEPALLISRSVDLRGIFGLLRKRFTYEDAGILSEQAVLWEDAGFGPGDAGHWRATGLAPAECVAWIRAGVPDPIAVAAYAWRSIDPAAAAPWYAAGFNGQDAAAWMAQGIELPERIPRKA